MSAETEQQFDLAVSAIGGLRVTEFLGRAPEFENADYIFPEYQIVAELKCLDEDKISDPRIIDKASELYLRELEAGRARHVVFGTVRMTTQGYSEEYARNIMNLYRAPVQALVKKANAQIKATREHLGIGGYTGLLIVANNQHSALDPANGAHLIGQLLETGDRFSAINGAVYFNAMQRVVDLRTKREVSAWVDISRSHLPPPSDRFLSALRRAWYERVKAIRGIGEVVDLDVDLERFSQLENRSRGTD